MHDKFCCAFLTFVVLRERIRVYDVKPAETSQLFAFDVVLPFSLQDLEARFIIPTLVSHMLENIGMRLNDDMLRWFVGQRLEHGINLK